MRDLRYQRRFRVVAGVQSLLVAFTLACFTVVLIFAGAPLADAGSRWNAGGSRDSVSGEAGAGQPSRSGARPSKRRSSCTTSCRRVSLARPGSATEARKEAVLPPPTLRISPAVGLAGSEAVLVVSSPASFADTVSAGSAEARVWARPTTARCTSPWSVATAPMEGGSERASSTAIRFPLRSAGMLRIVCWLEWDAWWESNEGDSGRIPDRASSATLDYRVAGVVGVLTG